MILSIFKQRLPDLRFYDYTFRTFWRCLTHLLFSLKELNSLRGSWTDLCWCEWSVFCNLQYMPLIWIVWTGASGTACTILYTLQYENMSAGVYIREYRWNGHDQYHQSCSSIIGSFLVCHLSKISSIQGIRLCLPQCIWSRALTWNEILELMSSLFPCVVWYWHCLVFTVVTEHYRRVKAFRKAFQQLAALGRCNSLHIDFQLTCKSLCSSLNI